MTCAKCRTAIKPGQLYVPDKGIHVACPSEHEIVHDEWMARAWEIYLNGRPS